MILIGGIRFVNSRTIIECAKHNGRFDITDGSPRRPPAGVPLKTYQAAEHDGKIFLNLDSGDRR